MLFDYLRILPVQSSTTWVESVVSLDPYWWSRFQKHDSSMSWWDEVWGADPSKQSIAYRFGSYGSNFMYPAPANGPWDGASAVRFDGKHSSSLWKVLYGFDFVALNKPWSVFLWYADEDATRTARTALFSFGHRNTDYLGIYFEDGRMLLEHRLGGTVQWSYDLGAQPPLEEWHLLSLTYNPATALLSFYQDETMAFSQVLPAALTSFTNEAYLGALATDNSDPIFQQYLKGVVSEMAGFANVLSAEQITQLSRSRAVV